MQALGAWTSPAVVSVLAAAVFAGQPGAPLLLLALVVAPLLALLVHRADGREQRGRVALLVTAPAAGCVLAASLAVVGEIARLSGWPPWPAVLAAAALVLAITLPWPAGAATSAAMVVGTVGLLAPLVVLGAVLGMSPWAAWQAVASRQAFEFGERTAWVREGGLVTGRTSLTFAEPHRVTAMSPGVYRVIERDSPHVAVREWRLSPGDALTLRPGDQLVLEGGARVRFESGKRVPGAPSSGVVWAHPAPRKLFATLGGVLGIAVTFLGGALALVRPRRAPGRLQVLLAALAALLLPLAAAAWGIYGAHAAPDLTLGRPPVALLVGLPPLLVPAPWSRLLAVLIAVGLVGLCVGTASALHARLSDLAARAPAPARDTLGRGLWIALLAAAALAASTGAGAPTLLGWGLGLAAASVVAPALASPAAPARLAGGLVGAGVLAALALLGPRLPAAPVLAAYPALLAAPLAWAAAWVAAGRRG